MKWLHTNACSVGNKQEEMVATAQLLSVDIYYSGEAVKEGKVTEMSSMQNNNNNNKTQQNLSITPSPSPFPPFIPECDIIWYGISLWLV